MNGFFFLNVHVHSISTVILSYIHCWATIQSPCNFNVNHCRRRPTFFFSRFSSKIVVSWHPHHIKTPVTGLHTQQEMTQQEVVWVRLKPPSKYVTDTRGSDWRSRILNRIFWAAVFGDFQPPQIQSVRVPHLINMTAVLRWSVRDRDFRLTVTNTNSVKTTIQY